MNMPNGSSASVAQPSKKNQLVSPNATNPLYDNIKENQLLLLHDETNLKKGRIYLKELFTRVETISGRYQRNVSTYIFFLDTGCSFARDLEKKLGYSRQSAHRIIEKLLNGGFIFPITKTDIPKRGGPKTTLYGVEDVTSEEIDKAITRDLQYSSKSYMHVEQLYQRTLPEIQREEIQYNKIVSMAKRHGGLRGFHFIDIAEQVARKHTMNGVKVWR